MLIRGKTVPSMERPTPNFSFSRTGDVLQKDLNGVWTTPLPIIQKVLSIILAWADSADIGKRSMPTYVARKDRLDRAYECSASIDG